MRLVFRSEAEEKEWLEGMSEVRAKLKELEFASEEYTHYRFELAEMENLYSNAWRVIQGGKEDSHVKAS